MPTNAKLMAYVTTAGDVLVTGDPELITAVIQLGRSASINDFDSALILKGFIPRRLLSTVHAHRSRVREATST
jgi:hypothetical protein